MFSMRIATVFAVFCLLSGVVSAQTAAERRTKMGKTIMQHADGKLGALAPQNLNKPRPAAPFNLTGTWFVDLSEGFARFRFGPP